MPVILVHQMPGHPGAKTPLPIVRLAEPVLWDKMQDLQVRTIDSFFT